MPGHCKPVISVGDKTHEGSSSNDVVIRNNLANGLGIYNLDPNMTIDHNVCAGIGGSCGAGGDKKPGDHNMVDERDNASEFVNYDPAKLVFDLRLKAGARAIGAGSTDGAPAVDITGAPRGVLVDAGAYRYSPGK
jgi:hypothetical protein